MSERLLPSDLDQLEMAGDNLQQSSQGGLKYSGNKIEILCAEIRACWAELDAERKQSRTQFEQRQFVGEMIENMPMNQLIAENELLRKIAIAAAEMLADRDNSKSELLEAVEAWQKSNRNSA